MGRPEWPAKASESTSCPESTLLGSDKPPAPGSIPNPLILQPRHTQKLSLAFGRSQLMRTRTLQFDVPAQAAQPVQEPSPTAVNAQALSTPKLESNARLAADFDPFVRDDDAELNRRMMSVRAVYSDGRVRLTLCADRAGKEPLGDPGTYQGVLSIIDARVARVDVPFTITLAYPGWPLVADLGILTVLAALGWVWLLTRSPANPSFGAWLLRGQGAVACGLGLAAAAAAFASVYLKSATWALDPLQIGGLVAAVFSAFVAAASISAVQQYLTRLNTSANK
jgi:hypothetical protein